MGKFFAEEGKDYHAIGWITDKGEFIECGPFEHDEIVEGRGLKVPDIEKKWIRIGLIFGRNHFQFQGKRINDKQMDALIEWGIIDLAGRMTASDNFMAAFDKAYE